MTLLEDAKEFPSIRKRKNVSGEELELGLAFLRREISFTQVSKAIAKSRGTDPARGGATVYALIVRVVAHGIESGDVIVKSK